jgi:hypothetical protein
MVPIVKWNAAIFELKFLDVALHHRCNVIYSSRMSTGVSIGTEPVFCTGRIHNFRTM